VKGLLITKVLLFQVFSVIGRNEMIKNTRKEDIINGLILLSEKERVN